MTLIRTGKEEYVLIGNKVKRFFSSEDKLVNSGLLPVGDILLAIHELKLNNHQVAKFGDIQGYFLFTDNIEPIVRVWN